jgi:amino acid adenylation domain-containing protein
MMLAREAIHVADGALLRALPTELVHRTIELQAAAAPEAIALRFRDQSLTYGELMLRANRLAHHLAATGIGPGDRVVVCVEPAFDILIALLAIFKVGAVYVPLDPSQPIARVRIILADIEPKIFITNRPLIERLALEGVATLALDAVAPLLSGLSGRNLNRSIPQDETACIYYTSGTTGSPKGVMVSYSNLASYIRVAQRRYRFTSVDVMPAIARFGFSISLFELLSPLAAGGTLLLLDRDSILDLAGMSRTMTEVTFFHAGPSLLKSLLPYIKRHHAGFHAFSRVRHASSGGDMVPPDVLESLREIFFNAEVFVIYGCSEISCMGCTYEVPRSGPVVRTYVGEPFDDMTVKVTDAAFNPVPVGVEGEVHFAGPGVVRGYLNRPELTADRFIIIDGRRFYRTGDVGRMSEEGWLEILGRSDFQVKIRGMRVELGEVEHHLRNAPGVRDAVVMGRKVGTDAKTLVAYIVMEDGEGGDEAGGDGVRLSAVRRHMAEHLPDYMLPATYMKLDRLPLNHNLKLDRGALPAPKPEGPSGASSIREAETPTERRLAWLWKKALRIEQARQVGLDDHFFDLGGDSMLALELILEIDRELGVVLEGMEVLRESLEVQASLCDRRLGKTSTPSRSRAPEALAVDAIELFHFGQGQSLYGVLHGARSAGAAEDEAVLICSPVGHEEARAHFVLQRLARQLAGQGVPALRFDYYGCRDSLGENIDATCARWQDDIVEASLELKRRTKATRITAIGVRLGATLLWNVAGRLDIAKLVLWDPVCQGAEHYTAMAEGHRRYLRAVQHLQRRRTAPGAGGEELLGATYSETALRELKALVIGPRATGASIPIKWLSTSRPAHQRALFRSVSGAREGCRVEVMDFDCRWQDLALLEDNLPDVGIARKLAEMAMERP